jgi:hypothetical protein
MLVSCATSHAVFVRACLGIGGALLLQACSAAPGEGRELGDDLGTFRVEASEQDNSCGAGVLGATPSFDFDVELASDALEIFWNNQTAGTLDSRKRFDLRASVSVEGEDLGTQPTCRLERRDHVWGTLRESEAGIDGFTGTMTYDFRAAVEAICDDFDREQAGVPVLPCQMRYELAAERTRAPEIAATRPSK